ncbi:hypothetical protein L3049_14140 [Labilibaculum sp. DW002]|uniref:Uncharacterized protein n=1 Tax=Paralabilibaculum antarcticum TaxID=2912572 RepID=A0ABT5VUN4_9BACT|nr:hypothetical protein [Labilibaculum sp. DW002]MDE5419136.1 hypothetical protein [Labilibaculum sp. DW002]
MSKNSTLNILIQMKDQLENIIASGDGLDSDKKLLAETEKSIKWVNSCNGYSLHEKQDCYNCGKLFTPKNQHQKCCSSNCRVQFHRAKKRLSNFNNKVQEMIDETGQETNYIIEQTITESNKCPFIVYIKGSRFESESTKSLLSEIKKALWNQKK